VDTALQLGGKTVCTQSGTTSELNLTDYFRANEMPLKVLALGTAEESRKAYDDRKCDVLTSDVSQLYAERLKLSAPDSHIILPAVISKEPLGPALRQCDDQWFNLVKWTLYSLINAEELGVKTATIDDAVKSPNPNIRRLVGTEGEFGEQLGLAKDWAARAVRPVGNYGEIYERNVGTQSRLSIPRGLNALWTQGGIQYAPPVRQIFRRQILTVDDYSLLRKAVAGKDAVARDQIYKDAFGLIARSHITREAAASHTAALEDAVQRIEDEIAAEEASTAAAISETLSTGRNWKPYAIGACAVAAVVALSAVVYGFVATKGPAVVAASVKTSPPNAQRGREDVVMADLKPGVDGGSSGEVLPFALQRQVVFSCTALCSVWSA